MQLQKNYKTFLTEELENTSTGEIEIKLGVESTSDTGYLIVEPGVNAKEESIFFHRKVGTSVFAYGVNRDNPIFHSINSQVFLASSIDVFNHYSNFIGEQGHIFKLSTSDVIIKGGTYYLDDVNVVINDVDTSLALTNKSLVPNAINYVHIKDGDYYISITEDTSYLLATITVNAGGLVTSIDKKNIYGIGTKGTTGSSITSGDLVGNDLIFTKDDTTTVTIIGAKLEFQEGNTDGNTVGNTVGNTIGNTTGNTIGNTTGNTAGNQIGNTLNNTDGNTVGNTTGNTIGNTTGNTVGNTVGNTLNNTDGNQAGNTVGNTVGNTLNNTLNNTAGNTTGNTAGNQTGNTVGNTTGNTVGNTTGNTVGNTIGTVQWQGPWVAGTYQLNDGVEYNGSSYVANVITTNTPPHADWDLMASKGADGIGAGDFLANGTVPMTGDLNAGGNDIINANTIDATGNVSGANFSPDFLLATDQITGFINNTGITLNYSHTNRTITLTGTIEYYYRGIKKTLASGWVSDAHTATPANYFLYSTDGTNFIWTTTPWAFKDVMVSFVSYKASALNSFALREVHGIMDAKAHEEFHQMIGTYRRSGGNLTAGTYTENTATDVATTPGFDVAVIKDEDIETTIPAWTEGTYTTMHIGAGSIASFNTTATFPFISAGSFLQVNNVTTGALTNGINSRWYNVYVILVPATADADSQKYRMIMLQPQTTHTSLANAQLENPSTLNLGDFGNLTTEWIIYSRITYVTANADANTGKCRIATGGVTYITGNRLIQGSGGAAPEDHSALDNVQWTLSGHNDGINSVATFGASGEATTKLLSEFVQTTGAQTVGGVKSFTDAININRGTGPSGVSHINMNTIGGVVRFRSYLETDESGSNTGSNFTLGNFDDAGNFLSKAINIIRSSGNIGLGQTAEALYKLATAGNILAKSASTPHIRIENTTTDTATLYLKSSGAEKSFFHRASDNTFGYFDAVSSLTRLRNVGANWVFTDTGMASQVTASALLALDSITKGFLPPRMTTTQRNAITTPATGLVIYNTTDNVLNAYNGTAWGAIGGGGSNPIFEAYIAGEQVVGLVGRYVAKGTQTIAGVKIALGVLPTGANFSVQVYKNGTATANSIFTSDTPISITTAQGATNGIYITTSTTIDNGSLVENDVLYFYVTVIGSTLSGADLEIICY